MTTQAVAAIALRNSIEETCAILKISRPTLYTRIAAGLLKITKDGRRSFVTASELERYLASCESPEAAK